MDLTTFVLNPATLLILIFGIVEFIKSLGLEGNKLRLVSMGTGIFLAVVFQVGQLYPDAFPIIQVIFFGLAAGLAASGVYSFVNNRLPSKEG
jgi:hypothetical protein